MKDCMFSIIVPVFNAEKFLPKTIESVINQSFADWELILVENGSTDKSLSICDKYGDDVEKSKGRIRVFTMLENCGANGARAKGVSEARGQYITFMDADDYVESNVLGDMYNVLCKYPAKLSVLGAIEEYYDKNENINTTRIIMPLDENVQTMEFAGADDDGSSLKVLVCTTEKQVREEIMGLEEKTLYGYLWNKFYDREYFQSLDIEFTNQPLLEDARFNLAYAMDVDSMNLVNIAAYHYCKREQQSLTSSFVEDYFKIHREHVQALLEQQVYFGTDSVDNRCTLANIYCRYICSALERNCHKESHMSHISRKNWVKNVFADKLLLELTDNEAACENMSSIARQIMKKSVGKCLIMGRAAYIMKNKMPGVFAKLRRK